MHDLKDGGAQRAFVNLANAISSFGVEIHLVVLDEGLLKGVLDQRVVLHKIESKRVLFSFGKFHEVIERINPDFIITGLIQNNVFLCLYKIIFRYPGKIVLSEHSIPSNTDVANESILIKLSSKCRSLIYRFSDLIVAVSNYCRDDLIKNFHVSESKIITIHNPVINDDFVFEKKLDKSRDEYLFCSVGRLHPVKNHSLLLDSLYLIKDKINFKLFILGDGPEKENIAFKINQLGLMDHVELKGFIREPFDMLKKSHIVIVSSKIEGFCNVVVESFACGVPVVSTKCFGPEEIIDSSDYGELCEHTPDAMANAILKVCSRSYDYVRLTEKSRNYCSAIIAKKYIKALECLL